jgi:hypothetical protein
VHVLVLVSSRKNIRRSADILLAPMHFPIRLGSGRVAVKSTLGVRLIALQSASASASAAAATPMAA